MELRHLRYFVALAENLSFTRAASQVHVSQPTLSHQIKQLETELGRRLFTRKNRQIALTPDGEAFLPHAAAALQELDTAVLGLRSEAPRPIDVVRIGAPSTLAVSIVPDALALLLATDPGAQVKVEEMPSNRDIVQRLLDESLDVGLLYPPVSEKALVVEPLYEEQAVLFVRSDHRLARHRKVRLVQLDGEKIIVPLANDYRELLEGLLQSVGAKPRVVVELVGFSSVPRLVQKAGLAAIVAQTAVAAGEGFRTIPIERPLPLRTAAMCFKRGRRRSAAVGAFASAVRQVAAQRRRR
jgi:LysR family cyn operon transcriptional activator